ncbi:MAG: DUF4935 domain-containing protein [Armatimonadetes bacterium]|nr:DUF4935 domain-containing protein [Armatimonadota bacterium]
MLRIFIDASVLPRPTRGPGPLEVLRRLRVQGLATVHVSQVAAREWGGQIRDEFMEPAKSLRRFAQRWPGLIPDSQKLEEALAVLDSRSEMDAAWQSTIEGLGLSVEPLAADHAQRVLDGYFEGAPPFAKPRARDDIPDAFIFECARDLLASDESDLHCAVADKGLCKALRPLERARVYKSLSDLLKSEPIRTALMELDGQEKWVSIWDKREQWFPSFEAELRGNLEGLLVDGLAGSSVEHPSIPDDEGRGLVVGVDNPDEVTLAWGDAESLGLGSVILPFEAQCDVELDFSVYRGDALDVPVGVWVSTPEDPYAHRYWDASGTVGIVVRGSLSLVLDYEAAAPALKECTIEAVDEVDVCESADGSIFV